MSKQNIFLSGLLIVLMLAVAGTSYAVIPKNFFNLKPGFITGQEFLEMKEHEKNAYVMGLADGMASFIQMGENKVKWSQWEKCGRHTSNIRFTSLLVDYLESNPGQPEKPMTRIWHAVIKSQCGF